MFQNILYSSARETDTPGEGGGYEPIFYRAFRSRSQAETPLNDLLLIVIVHRIIRRRRRLCQLPPAVHVEKYAGFRNGLQTSSFLPGSAKCIFVHFEVKKHTFCGVKHTNLYSPKKGNGRKTDMTLYSSGQERLFWIFP